MVLSLAVILVPVLLIVWFFTRTPEEPPVTTVDWRPVVSQARASAGYPVLAPAEVPGDWRATKARYASKGDRWVGDKVAAGNRWELGFLDDTNTYVAINQSSQTASGFVAEVTRSANADGQSTVAGRTWQRMVSPDGRTRALVTRVGSSTAVVVADADYPVLERFAGLLRAS